MMNKHQILYIDITSHYSLYNFRKIMNYVGKRFFYSQSIFFFSLTQKIGVYLFQERKKERKQQ